MSKISTTAGIVSWDGDNVQYTIRTALDALRGEVRAQQANVDWKTLTVRIDAKTSEVRTSLNVQTGEKTE